MYQIETVLGATTIRRLSDGACIPIDPPKELVDEKTGKIHLQGGNQDYSEYLAWVAKGNKAEVVDLTPVLSLDERRQAEYEKRGCTLDALSVALWEKVVEGRPEEADRLQVIREQVKIDVPKDVASVSRSRKRK